MRTIEDIRGRVPALAQKVYGKPLVYLDNAATAQKPVEVIELLNRMNSAINANVHRAMYRLSDEATNLYEGARERVREYINAPARENIIFTSGATASINLVASSFCAKFLKEGDAVIVTEESHHSNIVPWQLACERAGATLKVLPVDDNGVWCAQDIIPLLDEQIKIVAATHISNVLGIKNPVKELIDILHKHDIPVLIDGAQGIVHSKVDVQELDCDFYAFSAHKVYGETGSGILYGKEKWLEEMPPYMGGGDMVGTVTFAKTTYAPLPLKFEAGTPNFIGSAALKPALDFAFEISTGECGEVVKESEEQIIAYMRRALLEIEGTTLYGNVENKIPLFSFNVKGCHPGDIAQILDKMGIAVRTGMLCAEPLMNHFGVTSMVRASFAPYNTLQEAEYFITSLKRAVAMLR
ncbi:MAG: SufS family cysteine desulfurase [Bacteroidales bacterium]|nr:SufS family cysteine desulfurase [Bacteroidales bacterium]